jgi:hypothetical protein
VSGDILVDMKNWITNQWDIKDTVLKADAVIRLGACIRSLFGYFDQLFSSMDGVLITMRNNLFFRDDSYSCSLCYLSDSCCTRQSVGK